jgi:hypothetical protein
MSARQRLGDWTIPGSRNNVIVYYRPLGARAGVIEMEWDDPPPLRPADEAYYLGVIRPAVTRLVAEYTERTGRTLVIGA